MRVLVESPHPRRPGWLAGTACRYAPVHVPDGELAADSKPAGESGGWRKGGRHAGGWATGRCGGSPGHGRSSRSSSRIASGLLAAPLPFLAAAHRPAAFHAVPPWQRSGGSATFPPHLSACWQPFVPGRFRPLISRPRPPAPALHFNQRLEGAARMQVRRLVISLAVAALALGGPPWPRCRSCRPGARPGKKKAAAPKEEDYQLSRNQRSVADHGGHLHRRRGRGPGAAIGAGAAQAIRQNAYTYQKKFDFSKTVEGRGIDRLGGPQQMHYQRDDVRGGNRRPGRRLRAGGRPHRAENAQENQVHEARRPGQSRENQPDDGRAFTPSNKRRSRATKRSPKRDRWEAPS